VDNRCLIVKNLIVKKKPDQVKVGSKASQIPGRYLELSPLVRLQTTNLSMTTRLLCWITVGPLVSPSYVKRLYIEAMERP
jgi:hypothetical protein